MAIVKPFKAVRPSRDKVALVSSKSYDAYTDKELDAKLEFNPFTFLHIINPGYKYHKEFTGEQRFQMIHNRYEEFKENIRKNIKFIEDSPLDEDTLVIHIRSGDIFIDKKKDYYQNPINFYIEIMKEYKKVVVVTSEDKLNPICSELEKISKVTFQTLSMETDFNILYNSKNLATSGVGTFPIAAALLSKELNNFYYTNLYLDEHLNPEMLKDSKIVHHKYNINSSYIYEYEKQGDIKKLILDKSIEVQKEN